MSQADSAAITREVARLSSLAAEGEDPTFAGLPFIVRRVYRFTVGANSALVADVVRKISEEANPREEHILLVAERDNSSTGYVNVFHARVAGSEETVRTNEIVAAVRFVKGGTNALVIAFEYEGGGRIALLERTGNRTWKIRWRSAYTGC
jgi:hypothetical protein